MSLLIKDISATVYMLLDNASLKELDYPIFLEQTASVLQLMNYQKIFGNVGERIYKKEVQFLDTTGLAINTMAEHGDITFLEFNGEAIEECPVSMLDLYRGSGMQRAAFWTNAGDSEFTRGAVETRYIQLSIPQTGTLKIWYEPDEDILNSRGETITFEDSLRYCISSRVAKECLPYVKFENPEKSANKAVIYQSLTNMADRWEKVYLEKVNKIGTDRPFQRLPYMAG